MVLFISISIFFILIVISAIAIATRGSAARAKFKREAKHALSANAVVIVKRTQISGYGYQNYTYTNYFVTFDIEGVGRAEFNVAGNFSGLLVEGDRGVLRYLMNPLRFVDFTPASQFQQTQQ